MKNGVWILVLAIVTATTFVACGPEQKTGGTETAASAPLPIDRLQGHHPRLFLSEDKLAELKPALGSTHRWLWERYEQEIPSMIATARSPKPPDDVRYLGDLATELAFAWLMTGEDSLYTIARDHLLRLTDPETWKAAGSLIYLIGSHFLVGISLAYDWLYPKLSPAERKQVAECLGREAQTQYESIVTGRIWWRNQYFQNHSQSNFCGLAFAAAALWGEDQRAKDWMGECEIFFDKLLDILPADGSSVEGYPYAGYGAEYVLKYSAMASELLGRDYSDSPWMQNFTTYLVQGLLPQRNARTWVMTFGDGPQRGWTSTGQHLFYLARIYHDGRAQWMARQTVGLSERGLGSQGWMMLTFYDPSVPEESPSDLPTAAYFPEVGQVMLRSAWDDTSASMIGIKCGPYMGKTHSADAVFDWGTGHAEPDAGSFQIFAHGKFLAIGALYAGFKLSGNHNTMQFKGKGQLGENMPAGFGSIEALRFGHYPEIVHTDFSSAVDYVVGDVARAYHPALGLKKYLRHWLYLKPDILLIADEVELSGQGMVYDFPAPELQTGPGMTHNRYGQVTGTGGEAYTVFDGVDGDYKIYACYLDNSPETADYSITVDGNEIYKWKSHNEDRDDNLIEVTPPFALHKGSRIAFRGANMAEGTRLTKMAAFSTEVEVPRSARWVMHFEPETEVERQGGRLTEISGGSALDYFLLSPQQATERVENRPTPGGDNGEHNYKSTKRLVVEPKFSGDKLTMLTLINLRPAASQPLQRPSSIIQGESLAVSWRKDGVVRRVNWSLAGRSFTFDGK